MADFLDKLWDLEPTIAVEVARSRLTASFPQKSLLGLFLGLGLLFFVAYYLGEAATALRTFRHENNYFSFDFAWSIGVSLLFVWIIWNCIQIIGGYHQVLIANPTELELQTIVFGRI